MTVSVKSLQKQLIAAVAMVLVAMIALGSSTYAWFAANKEVTATGINITAKADTTYLLISKEKTTADEIQAEGLNTVDLSTSKTLYPAALKTASTNPFTDADDNWWYAQASAKDASTKKDGTEVTFGEANSKKPSDATAQPDATTFGERVLKQTVYLTLTDGSAPSTDLNVTLDSFTDNIGDATKVVVATADKALYFTKTTASTPQELAAAGALTDTTVLEVRIYTYFDGETASVYTDNITNLSTATYGVHFTLAD